MLADRTAVRHHPAMKHLHLVCHAVALVMLLVAAVPAEARHHRRAAAVPGEFDYYLLTLSIAPSFCALSPSNRAKQECQELTEPEFQQTPLTVHGLWPNRVGVSVNRQPQDCAGPSLGSLPQDVQAELRRYMPGGPGLERYEWRKHGACSGLAPDAYFSTVVQLAQHANETIGAALHEHDMLGHELRIAELISEVGRWDPALASAIIVDCKFPRGGGRALVDEIRVVLSKDFTPMPAQSVGLGQNSGCPQGVGFVPDVSN
jgi:ribonuclease T2